MKREKEPENLDKTCGYAPTNNYFFDGSAWLTLENFNSVPSL